MGTHVVTGAASGIGAATRTRLMRDGHSVIGLDRHAADVVADLGTADGRASAIEKIRAESGGRLEGVVSAAGLGPYDDAVAIARVNYFGAIAMLDGLRGQLEAGSEPAAVAISSVGAVFKELVVGKFVEACLAGDEDTACAAIADCDGNTAYVSAKHAVALAVRQRAPEWGALGIRLNAVAPGATQTPMLERLHADSVLGPQVKALPCPLGHSGPPEELASAIAFLLGADARYVHGTVLFVDGGSDAVVRPNDL